MTSRQRASSPRHASPDPPAQSARREPKGLGFYSYLVRDIMTRPAISIEGDASLYEAAGRMSQGGVSGLPVVQEGGELVGVVSEKDLLRVLHERAGLALPGGLFSLLLTVPRSEENSLAHNCREVLRHTPVRDAMSSPAISVATNVTVDEASRRLAEHHINRLPVTDRGKLVGIVTRTDLLGHKGD